MRNHMVSICRKRCSLVKSASILLTTKDILQITKEGYTNPVRGCVAGTCKNKPKSVLNNRLLVEHRKDHENVSCTECKKTFGAKRNMLRHIKNVHKKEDHDKTGNSNSSQIDMNLNFEQVDQLASVDLDQAIVLPFDM